MNKVLFSLDTQMLTPDAVQTLLSDLFGGEAWFLLEQPQRCLCGRPADLLTERWHKRFLCCTVFSDDAELRMEPDADRLCCRILREYREPPDAVRVCEGYARRCGYLLRTHKVTNPLMEAKKLTRLQHTEYFVPDAVSGMPILKAERLSGLEFGSPAREANA